MRAVERLRGKGTRPLLVALLGGVVLLLPALSCAFLPDFLVDRPGTATAEKLFVESRLEMTRQAQAALTGTAAAEQTAAAQATEVLGRTATAVAQATATQQARATATAEAQATRAALLTATQQAAGPAATAAALADEGLLPGAPGQFFELRDFQQEKNEVGAYIWWRSDYQPRYFVLHSRIDYETPGGRQDLSKAACGFMLWENGGSDWLRTVYTLDGHAQINAVIKGRFVPLGQTFHAIPASPKGNLEMTVVVNPTHVIVYIDGQKTRTTLLPTGMKQEGYLSYTLSAGSVQDYGLRCRFSDTWLWAVE